MAKATKGTVLQFASASSAAYTSISEVIDLTMGDVTRDRIDVTHLGTTNDQRSYIGGFLELGEVTFTVNYDGSVATHSGSTGGLGGLLTAGSTVFWKIVPGQTTSDPILFQGYVSSFQPNFGVGEQATADVGIQITTLPDYST